MCECFVRFGHAVHVVLFLHRSAATVDCIEKFSNEAVFHRFFTAVAGICHDPAYCQGVAPVASDFERNRRYTESSMADSAPDLGLLDQLARRELSLSTNPR